MAVQAQKQAGKVRWIPLEANPEVLNRFSSKLGLDTSKLSFCDIWGLDPVLSDLCASNQNGQDRLTKHIFCEHHILHLQIHKHRLQALYDRAQSLKFVADCLTEQTLPALVNSSGYLSVI